VRWNLNVVLICISFVKIQGCIFPASLNIRMLSIYT
jgi:hypothetical protein